MATPYPAFGVAHATTDIGRFCFFSDPHGNTGSRDLPGAHRSVVIAPLCREDDPAPAATPRTLEPPLEKVGAGRRHRRLRPAAELDGRRPAARHRAGTDPGQPAGR